MSRNGNLRLSIQKQAINFSGLQTFWRYISCIDIKEDYNNINYKHNQWAAEQQKVLDLKLKKETKKLSTRCIKLYSLKKLGKHVKFKSG